MAAAIEQGLEQLERPPLSLALCSVAAGLIVGFSAMAAAVMMAVEGTVGGEILRRVATALVYPFGFFWNLGERLLDSKQLRGIKSFLPTRMHNPAPPWPPR